MALDYNQKKQVNKNRPRKRPLKLLLLLIIGSIFSLYCLGIATGWLVFKYLPQKTEETMINPAKLDKSLPTPESPTAKNGPATQTQDKEPDLSFYYTLPKGEKGVIGSGINNLPNKTVSKNALPTPAAEQNDTATHQQHQTSAKSDTKEDSSHKEKSAINSGATQTAATAKNIGKTTYTVQVAAFHAKSDAQELKSKLQKIGFSCRIEEYSIPGKGSWYRVRTGSKLDKDTATKIAAKVGDNAILVTE
ncbi:MAG: SPOR domain-containing protein [Geobacteraceae bacterium]